MKKSLVFGFLLFFIGICLITGSPAKVDAIQQDFTKIHGLDIGYPIKKGQDPNLPGHNKVSQQQVKQLTDIVRGYTEWIRTFGVSNGLQYAPAIAKKRNLKVAGQAWIGPNHKKNMSEVKQLITLSKKGLIDIAIIGNEAVSLGHVSMEQLLYYIRYFKDRVPNVPVTTSEIYSTLIGEPDLINACDVIFANFYAYWEGYSIDEVADYFQESYDSLKAVSQGKQIIVAETGWPSGGDANWDAVPSAENAAKHFYTFVMWAESQGLAYFYFEAFDESWKAKYEGPQGEHWGIFDRFGILKPGMEAVFSRYAQPAQPICTSFDISWGACQPNGTQTGTIIKAYPGGCVGGNPVLEKPCDYHPPVCSVVTYSDWGQCGFNTAQSAWIETRAITFTSPAGCEVQNPVLQQPCSPPFPDIQFTYVPKLNTFENLEGKVSGVNVGDYVISVYIRVGVQWWSKPYWDSPTVPIFPDGSWACDITTGGSDQTANKIIAFLIPKTYNPPLMSGQVELPTDLYANATDYVETTR